MTAYLSPTRFAMEAPAHACRACAATLKQTACGAERFLRTGQTLMLCGECGLAYLTPDFTDAALEQFYRTDYRRVSLIDATDRHDADFFRKTLHAEFARVRVALLAAQLPMHARLLEIGSGFGGFLGALHEARPDIALFATETDIAHRHHLLAQAPVTFLQETDLPSQAPFDAIVLFHVLEHLKQPVATLRQLAACLTPAGKIIIEVPDATANWGNWLYVQPAHLSYFTAASLQRILARAGIAAPMLQPHPAGAAFADNLWAVGSAAAMPLPFVPASAEEINALRQHIARYRWNRRQALRYFVRGLVVRFGGLPLAGKIARYRHYRRQAPLFTVGAMA